jgi:hypothetical protein
MQTPPSPCPSRRTLIGEPTTTNTPVLAVLAFYNSLPNSTSDLVASANHPQLRSEALLFAHGAECSYDPDDLRKRVLYPAMKKAGVERKITRSYGFHSVPTLSRVTDAGGHGRFEADAGLSWAQRITSDVYVHLQPDSEVESMKKLEETFFSELCSSVPKTRVEGQKGMVN